MREREREKERSRFSSSRLMMIADQRDREKRDMVRARERERKEEREREETGVRPGPHPRRAQIRIPSGPASSAGMRASGPVSEGPSLWRGGARARERVRAGGRRKLLRPTPRTAHAIPHVRTLSHPCTRCAVCVWGRGVVEEECVGGGFQPRGARAPR